MSLKFTGDLCIMTMKNDVKFELKLTGQFKTDMSDLTILTPVLKISIICTLMGCF